MSNRSKRLAQVLISRLPYAEHYDITPVIDASKNVEERSLICLSVPIHIENPAGAIAFIHGLVQAGLTLASLVVWRRDRQIVVSKNRRLTNMFELLGIFSRSEDYVMSKDAIRRLKRGFEGKTTNFDEEEFLCCAGDHWSIRNDRRDRRFLPSNIVMNLSQLADLKPGDTVLDLWGNPAVKETCEQLGWKYWDAGLDSPVRNVRKKFTEKEKEEETE